MAHEACTRVSAWQLSLGAIAVSITLIATLFFFNWTPTPCETQFFNLAAPTGVPWQPDYTANATRALKKWRTAILPRVIRHYSKFNYKPKDQAVEEYKGPLNEPPNWERFELFDPNVACPGGQLQRVGGDGDGGKWLCVELLQQKPCVVYSLGSNGDFSFEEAMLARTSCEIFTFDCTSPPRTLSDRHHFHSICIGNEKEGNSGKEKFLPLSKIAAMLEHSRIDVLKMDIEGSEFDVIAEWDSETRVLPLQIAFELHYWGVYSGTARALTHDKSSLLYPRRELSLGELALLMQHLNALGYAIVSRENNVGCEHCCEFTIIKTSPI